MCNCPLYILNPSRRYNLDAPLKIAVPCGHCSACRKQKRDEWFFRSLVEYNYYIKRGGAVYFVTLTYNDENIPRLVLPDGTIITAFSRSHIRLFAKYIRIWLKRHGYPYDGIKYLICSEYGGHSTKRPHYHGILYLPYVLNYWTDKIPVKERKGTSPFCYFISHVWKHGFVVCSKLGWRIQSVKGLRYASKYITKDISYIKCFNLAQYLYNSDYVDWREQNKDFFPKHWQSVGYGEDFINEIEKQTDIPRFLVDNKACVAGLDRSTVIPRYYHYRLCRVVNRLYSSLLDKTVTDLTQIGLQVKRLHLENSIIRMTTDLDVIFQSSLDGVLPSVSEFSERFAQMCNRSPRIAQLLAFLRPAFVATQSSYAQVRDMLLTDLQPAIKNCGCYSLALYRLFLRYMPINYDEVPEFKFEEVSSIISNMVCNGCEPPEYNGVISNDGLSVYGLPLVDNHHLIYSGTCSRHEYFQYYEYACNLLDLFALLVGVNNDGISYEKEISNEVVRYSKGSKPKYFKSIV